MGGDRDDAGWIADAEAVGGDDAVVEDVVDVGLGGEAAEGGGVVFRVAADWTAAMPKCSLRG